MKRFVNHLRDNGYIVQDDIAILQGVKFKICSGIVKRDSGNYKGYWLQLK